MYVWSALVVVILLAIGTNLVGWRYASVLSANAVVNKYEVRSALLMQATNHIGACSPEATALVWASGLHLRSAALQYAVMTKELKLEYAQQLEETAPNWVTGMSSPWVYGYSIVQHEAIGDNKHRVKLTFATMTSTGPAGNYQATLLLIREGEFWRIAEVAMDNGLYPYTGFIKEHKD